MTTKYLKVEDAFSAIKVLWPNTRNISKHNHGNTLINDMEGFPYVIECKINWPKGVTVWPQPEKKWRPATIQDFIDRSEARFTDYLPHEHLPLIERVRWLTGTICGHRYLTPYPWMNSSGVWFKYCEVLDE